KSANETAFNTISDNILENIYEADPETYQKLTNRIVRDLLHNARVKGENSNDEQLELAAQILNHRIFGEKETKPYTKTDNKSDDKRASNLEELREQQIQFAERQLEAAVADVNSRSQNLIRNTIDKNIDPKDQMSKYVRSKAIDDVLIRVDK